MQVVEKERDRPSLGEAGEETCHRRKEPLLIARNLGCADRLGASELHGHNRDEPGERFRPGANLIGQYRRALAASVTCERLDEWSVRRLPLLLVTDANEQSRSLPSRPFEGFERQPRLADPCRQFDRLVAHALIHKMGKMGSSLISLIMQSLTARVRDHSLICFPSRPR